MMNPINIIEECKSSAARKAVKENLNGDSVVGIGSGTTMIYVLKNIKQRCEEENFKVQCVPTSFQSKQLIHDFNLPVTDIDCHPVIDWAIDGADEVDENFVAIKGGGACLAQEKVVAFAAKKFVVVADYRKNSKYLGENWKKGIPIEVLPMANNAVRHHLCTMFKAKPSEVTLRIGKEKAGPVITDNGNFVLDWRFSRVNAANLNTSAAWKTIAEQIKLIPGVVETGIFTDIISEAYFGQTDGTVLKRSRISH